MCMSVFVLFPPPPVFAPSVDLFFYASIMLQSSTARSHTMSRIDQKRCVILYGGGYKKCCDFAAISTNFATTWH